MTDSWPPHLTVACIVEDNQRFLMVEELSHGRLVINQPAGHLEPGESMVQAAIREAFEETGWQVEPTHLLGIFRYTAAASNITYYRTSFIAKPVSHDPTAKLDEGIQRALWMTYDELLAAKDRLRSRLVLDNIKQYLVGVRYPLSVIDDHEH